MLCIEHESKKAFQEHILERYGTKGNSYKVLLKPNIDVNYLYLHLLFVCLHGWKLGFIHAELNSII